MNRFIDNWMKWWNRLLSISFARRVYKRRCKQINRYLLLVLAIVVVSACGSTTTNQTQPRDSQTVIGDCRLVSHKMGETEICGKPQKVAVLTPPMLDRILALGVQPAAYAEAVDLNIQTYDNPTEQIPYLGQWVKTQPVSVGSRDAPSLEGLTLLQPDLILGEEWQNNPYSLMTQIAPTLILDDYEKPGDFWQTTITGIAKALEREDRLEELLAEHEQQIVQARAALQPVLQSYPRVFVISSNVAATEITLRPLSNTVRLLKEIGFEVVQPENVQRNLGKIEISAEILSEVEADSMVVISAWDDYSKHFKNGIKAEDAMPERWEKVPLLNSLPVSQQDRVFFVDYYLWGDTISGPLSDKLILEALPNLLLDSMKEKA